MKKKKLMLTTVLITKEQCEYNQPQPNNGFAGFRMYLCAYMCTNFYVFSLNHTHQTHAQWKKETDRICTRPFKLPPYLYTMCHTIYKMCMNVCIRVKN